MNDLFIIFINSFIIVYFDDILIYSSIGEEHVHIRKMFQDLHREKLLLKMYKCEFGKESLVYLGHVISHVKLKIDLSKVSAIVY